MESGQEFHDVVDGRFAVGQIFQDVGDVATRLYDPLGVQIFALLVWVYRARSINTRVMKNYDE